MITARPCLLLYNNLWCHLLRPERFEWSATTWQACSTQHPSRTRVSAAHEQETRCQGYAHAKGAHRHALCMPLLGSTTSASPIHVSVYILTHGPVVYTDAWSFPCVSTCIDMPSTHHAVYNSLRDGDDHGVAHHLAGEQVSQRRRVGHRQSQSIL